ncbi:MAG: LamG-like jellyroll fold domain-containing protein [Planctomycetota bacterium]
MRNLRLGAWVLTVGTATAAQAELLVHYTFDTVDLSGSTVVDSAGADNNATIVGQVGVGAPGVLGEAIRLPNDDELSYVVLPASNNPTPAGGAARTIAFWFSQAAVGVENKIFGYGDAGLGRSFDVSLEGGGVRLRYSGGNYTWGSGLDFVGDNAGYHHLAIRVPESAVDYADIEVFLDGAMLAGVPTAGDPAGTPISTGGGSPTSLNLGRSPAFDPAGDFIGLLDDFRIYSSALSDLEIGELAGVQASLVFDIDSETGAVSLRNPTGEPVPLDYYELTSESGALAPAGWIGLQTQDRPGFAKDTGVGAGWATLGAPSIALIAEATLGDESVLMPGDRLPLGLAWFPDQPLDVRVAYRTGGVFRNAMLGLLEPGIPGDYNGDGGVDLADYTVWRNALNTPLVLHNDATHAVIDQADYQTWVNAVGGGAAPAPEPAGVIMVLGAIAATSRFRAERVSAC